MFSFPRAQRVGEGVGSRAQARRMADGRGAFGDPPFGRHSPCFAGLRPLSPALRADALAGGKRNREFGSDARPDPAAAQHARAAGLVKHASLTRRDRFLAVVQANRGRAIAGEFDFGRNRGPCRAHLH